jgi:hypothetical protein
MKNTKENKILALIALTLGVLALISSWIPFVNNIAGIIAILAIILGTISIVINRKNRKDFSIVSIVISIVAIVVTLATQSLFSNALNNASDSFHNPATPKQSSSSKKEEQTSSDTKEDKNNSNSAEEPAPVKVNAKETPKKTTSIKQKTTEKSKTQLSEEQQDQNILDTYSKKLRNMTPQLIEEINKESKTRDISELINEKIIVLAEIANMGIQEMAEVALTQEIYDTDIYYNYANKLLDVYQIEAAKLWDVILTSDTVDSPENSVISSSSEKPSSSAPSPSVTTPAPSTPPSTPAQGPSTDISMEIVGTINWYIAASDKCFVPKQAEDNSFYSKIRNMDDYEYMTQFEAENKGYIRATTGIPGAKP